MEELSENYADPRFASILEGALAAVAGVDGLKAAPVRNRLLVLCHDDASRIDRRILLQTGVWISRGYQVVIICVTSRSSDVMRFDLPSGETVVAFPIQNMPLFKDPLWVTPSANANKPAGLASRIYTKLVVIYRYAKERAFRLARHYKRYIAPLVCWAMQFRRVTGSWYPMPFTTALIQHGANFPSAVVLACDLPALPAGAWLARAWGAKLLYDSHELYPEQVNYDAKQKFVLKVWENWGIRQAALAYTNSENNARFMAAAYEGVLVPGVITNATVFPECKASAVDSTVGPLRKAIGVDKNSLIFLYHGGFSLNRNLETMIAGFAKAKMNNAHLVLLGDGDVGLITKAMNRAKSKQIHMLNAVPQEELGAWVADANMVIVPYPAVDENTRFCSPNKLFDCIEMFAPVMVNADLVTVGEIVKAYKIGCAVPMHDEDEMAAGFVEAAKFGHVPSEAFQKARSELGWPAQRKIIDGWIDTLVGQAQAQEEKSA